jgi:hypothetical protein
VIDVGNDPPQLALVARTLGWTDRNMELRRVLLDLRWRTGLFTAIVDRGERWINNDTLVPALPMILPLLFSRLSNLETRTKSKAAAKRVRAIV